MRTLCEPGAVVGATAGTVAPARPSTTVWRELVKMLAALALVR